MKNKLFSAVILTLAAGLLLTSSGQALLGDLDISGEVDAADMQIVSAAYGSHAWAPVSPNWDWRADINRDDRVNLADLALMGRNYGDSFNFHWPRRVTNGRAGSRCLSNTIDADAAIDSQNRIHIVVNDGEKLYYTQVDLAGNTLVDDLYIDSLVDAPRIAVDGEDNVHISWHATYDSPNMKAGVLYARLSPSGKFLTGPTLACDRCLDVTAIATDANNHAHLLARGSSGQLYYTILDRLGNPLLERTRLNSNFTALGGGQNPAIAVDDQGTRHILWYEDTPGVSGDLIYSRIPLGELPDPNQAIVAHITLWNPHRLGIQVDSNGAAHILWHDSRDGGSPGAIYWRKINPDGTLSPEKLVTTSGEASAGLAVWFAIDELDQIHLVARDKYLHLGYARLDPDGNVLAPFQVFLYGEYHTGHEGNIVLAPGGRAVVVYEDRDPNAGCSGGSTSAPLFLTTTVPDAAAHDLLRADLVLDPAHSLLTPVVARIGATAMLTVTVANGGWAESGEVTLSFEELLDQSTIPNAVIPSLPPFSSTTVVRTFPVPAVEAGALLDVRVTATTDTAETTLANNVVTQTLAVLPPARTANVLVEVFDETNAPDNRALAAHLTGAQLSLTVPALAYQAEITSTSAFNGFVDIPLDPSAGSLMTTTLELTLAKPGYASAVQTVTAARYPTDPYRIRLLPAAPIRMYLNQWGNIQGTVLSGTVPLSSTLVSLDGGPAVTTDLAGSFAFTKVVSGTHTLQSIHAGSEPTTIQVDVRTGETAAAPMQSLATPRGFIRGTITNDLGHAFSGAQVSLSGDGSPLATTVTDDQGKYSFVVSTASQYTAYSIQADCDLCIPAASGTFSIIPGVPYPVNIGLSWDVTASSVQVNGDVTSWEQQEGWNDLDYDEMPLGLALIDYVCSEMINQVPVFGCEIPFESYQVNVSWGMYHYALGLNYSEVGGMKTIESLGLDLTNGPLYGYDVQGDGYTAGVEEIERTALRIDRVDLVEMDSSGNVTSVLKVIDDSAWYVRSPDGTPTWNVFSNLQADAGNWSSTAVRIFVRVGKYDASVDSRWAPWHPPVAVASLSGSGSAAGADYQTIIWRPASGQVEVLKSMAYYQDALDATVRAGIAPAQPALPAVQPEGVTLSLDLSQPEAPRLGAPCVVNLNLAGALDTPVYGIEFTLNFDPDYWQVLRVQGGPDFAEPHGAWVIPPPLEQGNVSGALSQTAVVRLSVQTGLTSGSLVQITLLPQAVTSGATLELSGVTLVGPDGVEVDIAIVSLVDLQTPIGQALLFLPAIYRGP